nr:uncharacterized protein LOC111985705 [Quercus suber]
MALKAKSSDTNGSSDDEDSKMKSYISRQFKKFMKNANGKGFKKDHRQSSSSQFKSQDEGKKDARDGGFDHMKQECPTYLKTIGKSKVLAATLNNTEPKDDSDKEDDGILNAFTATINPTKGIVEDVNARVGCIARWQAHLGGFMESSSPLLKAPEASEDDDDSDDNDGKDGDASSSNSDEMST